MALAVGGGGGFAPAVSMGAPAAMMPQAPTMDFGGFNIGAAGEGFSQQGFQLGAFDTRWWERQGEDSGPDGVLCIEFGDRTLRGARWASDKASAVTVKLGTGGAEVLDGHVGFDSSASAKGVLRWLDAASQPTKSSRALPKGLVCGRDAADGRTGEVRSVARLLGLRSPLTDTCHETESKLTGATLCTRAHEAAAGGEAHGAEDAECGENLAVLVKLDDSQEEFELTPQELSALLLAVAAHRAKADEEVANVFSSDVALSVPGWWSDSRRAAAVTATSSARLKLSRLCSRPLCIATALHAELCSTKEACRVLLLDIGDETVEAAVLEHTPPPDESEEEGESVPKAVPSEWRLVSTAGGYSQLEASMDALLNDACDKALRDASDGELLPEFSAIVVRGTAERSMVEDALNSHCKHMTRLKELPVLRAPPTAAATGLSAILASEARSKGATVLRVVDCLSESIAVRVGAKDQAEGQAVDVLFKRGCRVPAEAKRTYKREGFGGRDASVTILQSEESCGMRLWSTGESWKPMFRVLEVFTALDDNGEPGLCDGAMVVFELNPGGVVNAYVGEVYGMPKARPRRRALLLRAAFFLLLLVSGVVWWQNNGNVHNNEFRARLRIFMQQNNPAKLHDIDSWMRDYRGKEDLLIRRLERKYQATFPASASAAAGKFDL